MLRCFWPSAAFGDDGGSSSSGSDQSESTRRPRKRRARSRPEAFLGFRKGFGADVTDKPASCPDLERIRAKPEASDRSSSPDPSRSESISSLASASTVGDVPTASSQQTPLPPLDAHPRRSGASEPRKSGASEPPTPLAPLPAPSRCPADLLDFGSGLFTASSFQTRREPLTGNLRYRKIRDLNRGSVGFVQLARDNANGNSVAIKFVEREHSSLSKGLLLREIGNQKAAWGHPHITQLLEVFVTEHHIALVMEYANGGDLSQWLEYCLIKQGGPPAESETRRLFQQLITALDFCHRLGIANRDVKLDNLLLHVAPNGRPTLKLCDFGLSKDEVESNAKSSCGTPEYMSPEVLMGDVQSGTACDVWSCGVTLYVLLAGQFPFLKVEEEAGNQVERMAAMLPRIARAEYQPLPATVSPACADLLDRMLTADPAKRIAVADILAHPWVATTMPAPLAALNTGLISLMGLATSHPAAAQERYPTGESNTFLKKASLSMEEGAAVSQAVGEAVDGFAAFSTASRRRAPPRRGAASMDLPRIGAAAANRAHQRIGGGNRQSLAEIAGLLASAAAATATSSRRAVRSLDLHSQQRGRSAPAAVPAGRRSVEIRPGEETRQLAPGMVRQDSLSRPSM